MRPNLWLTIAAPNLDPLVSFYRELLEQPPQIYIPDRYAEFGLPQFRLGIFKPQVDQVQEFRPNPYPQPLSPLSLCLEVSNLETALLKSQGLGASLGKETIQASYGRERYIYDPLGNRIILYEPFSSIVSDPHNLVA
jgi:predicted enzyme related to lactoylglutathione lyase